MSLTTAQLLERHEEEWRAATAHEFLDQVREGTLSELSFGRWLEQDYLFVVGLSRAWGRLLAQAPVVDFELVASGVTAFSDELAWFRELASGRDLRLGGQAMPDVAAYIAYLNEVAAAPYPVAITAMWAVEAAYLRAWQGARGGGERYAELIEHWVSDDFAAFVARLALVADRELAASEAHQRPAEEAFVMIARHEALFWGLSELG